MFPEYSYFLSYRLLADPNDYALLGDEYGSNIAGHRNSIFLMNRLLVLVRNALHAQSLRAPLYSTHRHHTQPGCTYYNEYTVVNLLLLPTMVIDVDSTTDNIFSFQPIGRTLRDRKIDYAEPRPDSARLTKNYLSLDSIDILILTQPTTKYPIPDPLATPPPKYPRPAPSPMPPKVDSVSPPDITKMHLAYMPDIFPCNTASSSDTMRAFNPLKLHHIFGCRHFRNSTHITSAADNHRWDLPVLHYHKIMVIYPYPFLVVMTQLFSWIIFINDCICVLTGSPG